jgi:hypothetical protein
MRVPVKALHSCSRMGLNKLNNALRFESPFYSGSDTRGELNLLPTYQKMFFSLSRDSNVYL